MKTEKKKHLLSIIPLAIIGLAALSYSGYKIKEELQHKQWTIQALSNADNYIKNKYGFEADIERNPHGYWSMSENYGVMNLSAKYGDRDFLIICRCDTDSTAAIDNYQYDEIMSALSCEISKIFPNSVMTHRELFCSCDDNLDTDRNIDFGFYGFNTYYDGTNLADILENTDGKITAACYDAELSAETAEKIMTLTGVNIDFELTKFDTPEHLNDFVAEEKNYDHIFDDRKIYDKYAPYITDSMVIKDGNYTSGISIDINRQGD